MTTDASSPNLIGSTQHATLDNPHDGPHEPESPFAHISHVQKRRLLEGFARYGTVTRAANHAGCSRRSHAQWMQDDDTYSQAFRMAQEMFADRIEGFAFDWLDSMRANGFRGANMGMVAMLLNGHRGDKYLPNQRTDEAAEVGRALLDRLKAARSKEIKEAESDSLAST